MATASRRMSTIKADSREGVRRLSMPCRSGFRDEHLFKAERVAMIAVIAAMPTEQPVA